MAQRWLFFQRTHTRFPAPTASFGEPDALFWLPLVPGMHTIYGYACRQSTQIHKVKIKQENVTLEKL